MTTTTTAHHNRFTAIFPGPPGSAGARRENDIYLKCKVIQSSNLLEVLSIATSGQRSKAESERSSSTYHCLSVRLGLTDCPWQVQILKQFQIEQEVKSQGHWPQKKAKA